MTSGIGQLSPERKQINISAGRLGQAAIDRTQIKDWRREEKISAGTELSIIATDENSINCSTAQGRVQMEVNALNSKTNEREQVITETGKYRYNKRISESRFQYP